MTIHKRSKYSQNKLIKLENINWENKDNLDKLFKLYEAVVINEEGELIDKRME